MKGSVGEQGRKEKQAFQIRRRHDDKLIRLTFLPL